MTTTEYYRKNGAWQQIGGEVTPTPPLGIIYGTNQGTTTSMTDLVTQANPQIVRVYSTPTSTNTVSTWGTSPAGPVPDDRAVAWSIKPSLADLQVGSPNYSAQVTKWRTILGGAPANQLIWFVIWHEPYDDMVEGTGTSFTLAEWKNAQINFRADVIDFVNSTRTYPILLTANLHGDSAVGHTIAGQPSIYSLLSTDVLDALHEFSLDTYNVAHLPAWDTWVSQYGQGKRWGIFEFGYNLGVTPTPTDQQVLDRMAYYVETQFPSLVNPLSFACWFNSGGDNFYNAITGGENPGALAYWKSLCDSCPAGTPEVYFNGYNP